MSGYVKITQPDLKFNTDRQRELMRVILATFAKYEHRKQGYYLTNGSSTAQMTLEAMADFTTLRAFWPRDLVKKTADTTIYGMDDGTLSKVQSSVRSVLDQLGDRSFIERLGNEDERRWRPNKYLRGVTL